MAVNGTGLEMKNLPHILRIQQNSLSKSSNEACDVSSWIYCKFSVFNLSFLARQR